MKILSIIFLSSVLSISKSDQIINDKVVENKSTVSALKRENIKLPIFPKNNIKFTVKPPNIYNIKPATSSEEDKIGTRKKLMAKIIPIPKKIKMEAIEPVTRKPLMKVRTYTVKMSYKGKNNLKEDIHRENENHSEENNTIADGKNKKLSLKKMGSQEFNNIYSIRETIKNKTTTDILNPEKFSKEEEQDRNEFIFLEKKNKDFSINDMINLSDEDFDTTTVALLANIRRKRSSNIIEEENMGTTVSPLKYTGRDGRLTNDLHFKNINH